MNTSNSSDLDRLLDLRSILHDTHSSDLEKLQAQKEITIIEVRRARSSGGALGLLMGFAFGFLMALNF